MDNIFSSDRKIIDLNSKDLFSIESFANLQKFSPTRIDTKKQIIYDWPMIELDSISRNGSLYESTGFIKALNSVYIKELIHRGTFFGCLDHPDPNCSREEFLKVDNKNINHRIMSWRRDGNTIKGDIQFVPPKGPITWDWVNRGINLSLSTRVLTPNYEERKDANGNPYIHKFGNMRLVTFDMISSAPGFKSASIVPDVDSYDASKENWSGVSYKWVQGRKKEEFMRLLESQESLPIMEDIYGFSLKDAKNISYSEEGMIVIDITHNKYHTKSIHIPTNVYLVNKCLGFDK